MTPITFYLSEVTYFPEKRQVIVGFSSGRQKRSARYSFFPFLHLPKTSVVSSVLSSWDLKKIKLEEKNGSLEVICSTMWELEKIISALDKKGLAFSALEPERQFLLLSGWSFFDAFSFETGSPQKIGSFPDHVSLSAIEKNFSGVFQLLSRDSEDSAKVFLKKICFSHILRVHASKSMSVPSIQGIFENWFFLNSKPVPLGFSEPENKPFSSTGPGAMFDFSPVLAALFSGHNLGIETIDCECCTPASASDSNVLPNSLVSCEFLLNGFYFESKSPAWREKFHSSKPFAEHRVNRKNEWFLSSIPVGPFYKGDVEELPLVDASALGKKAVKITGSGKLSWFCRKKKSFIAQNLDLLLSLRATALKAAGFFESESLAKSGVLFFASRQTSFRLSCLEQLASTAQELAFSVPPAIGQNKHFFGSGLVDAFSCLSEGHFAAFCSLVEKNNFHVLSRSQDMVFVGCEKPLALAEVFSSSFGLPKPLILSQVLSEKT
ncbi:MAG: hypothetical protein AAB558_00465 [Patescibacteria group bacterium]